MSRLDTVRERMNNREKLHHYYLYDLMRQLEYDLHDQRDWRNVVPEGWQDIATRPNQPLKNKLTLRVDEDVIKFFRKTGRGYQTRMNDVLRAFMEARLSGLIKDGARFERYVENADFTGRPSIGDLERSMAEADALVKQREQDAKEAARRDPDF